jgi:hypothetical protein
VPQVVIEHIGQMPRTDGDTVPMVRHAPYVPCFTAQVDGRTLVQANGALPFPASSRRLSPFDGLRAQRPEEINRPPTTTWESQTPSPTVAGVPSK